MNNFKNLTDIYKAFPNEEACYQYLESTWWGGNITCPYCESTKPYRLRGYKRFKCSQKGCLKKFSIISGTIFENTKIPIQKWFLAIYIATSQKKELVHFN